MTCVKASKAHWENGTSGQTTTLHKSNEGELTRVCNHSNICVVHRKMDMDLLLMRGSCFTPLKCGRVGMRGPG